jgi:nitrite reductase/ring-hydroxylating ferredoxin subunit
VRTGCSVLEPERYRVKAYDVTVEDGDLVVEL